ncbi:MAG: OsmC family protein [Pseudonocardiaceae bacterium]
MHMRGQKERHFAVHLEHRGGFRFLSQASEDGRLHGEPIQSDEPDPVGEASAHSTPALFGTALAHCLSASLLDTLRHAHIEVHRLTTNAVTVVAPNHEGLPRIRKVEVVIRPQVSTKSPRLQRCAEVFEKHCTVTASVREAVEVDVRVDWQLLENLNGVAPEISARDR